MNRRDETTPLVPTLAEVRYLLNELHHGAEDGGGLEPQECLDIERVLRWLLNEYLRRGEHVCNESDEEADRVA